MHTNLPDLDAPLRQRLVNRFGKDVESWLDQLPPVLAELAARWKIQLCELIPRGHMSVVVKCLLPDRRPGVLKICPDRERIAKEADALQKWHTVHVPSVLAVDVKVGALLIEAIEPGTTVQELSTYPAQEVAVMLTALHGRGVPDTSYPKLKQRVEYLFDGWKRHRQRRPELIDVVTPELYERGRQLALRLAEEAAPMVLLHGDLNPGNVLYGGNDRGLVAIDPAPCIGDAAFDAVDLLMWQIHEVSTIQKRSQLLAAALGLDTGRVLDWCVAFAGMTASELASERNAPADSIRAALELAEGAPV
jgi:streptomycin 6-kinase